MKDQPQRVKCRAVTLASEREKRLSRNDCIWPGFASDAQFVRGSRGLDRREMAVFLGEEVDFAGASAAPIQEGDCTRSNAWELQQEWFST
jgi:hypothetical protein